IMLGCGWLGAIAVPINTAAKGPQLRYVLENSGARLLVVETALEAVLDHCPLEELPLERIWIIGDAREARARTRPVEAFTADAAPVAPDAIKAGDTLAILYTSGTTGPAKGVCCPHAQFYWWGTHSARFLALRSDD